MLNQNADNFLWFVMTDPLLEPELMERLEYLLQPRPNFYLVKSNAKLLAPSDVMAILPSNEERNNGAVSAATNQTLLLSGDIDLLRHQMLDPNRSLLLETRLDADDGLNFAALSEIQSIAKALPVDTRGWQIICSKIHFEWRNDEVLAFENPNNNTINNNTLVSSSGTLRLVQESICVTPGYTLVRHREPPSIDFPNWPKFGHHMVIKHWPECKVEEESSIGTVVESNEGNATHDCWKRMRLFPSALRSRTITSAGMSRIQNPPGASQKIKNRTERMWGLVQREFNIVPQQAISVSQYMKDHLAGIVADNLKGQCTPGHSCKNSSKVKLEEVLEQTKQWKLGSVS
mmetsp:Transcript_438/g.991  ORF Transcript_438/g.991 Transcript_438/m.991 type:complete len:345 (-) Transcript_438:19-1053(-)